MAPGIADALRATPADARPHLVGVSCCARGADPVFARVVLDLAGDLEVVLPAADHRANKVKADNRDEFDGLIGRATVGHVMPVETSDRAAYEAATEPMRGTVDLLVAVWDGEPPDGGGGTADTVRIACERGVPVTVVRPGAARTSP